MLGYSPIELMLPKRNWKGSLLYRIAVNQKPVLNKAISIFPALYIE